MQMSFIMIANKRVKQMATMGETELIRYGCEGERRGNGGGWKSRKKIKQTKAQFTQYYYYSSCFSLKKKNTVTKEWCVGNFTVRLDGVSLKGVCWVKKNGVSWGVDDKKIPTTRLGPFLRLGAFAFAVCHWDFDDLRKI